MGGKIVDNEFYGNCAGIFLLDTGAPGAGGNVTVRDNKVHDNNKACAASEDAPPFSGIGIGILGDHTTKVEDNRVENNTPGGPSVCRPVASSSSTRPASVARRRPTTASRTTASPGNQPDIFWDGTGTGNKIKENRCDTSNPAGLCG